MQNGTYGISANESKPTKFDSRHFLTYQLPFAYDPTATAPIFEKYLNTVIPDIEKQKVLSVFKAKRK